MQLPACSKCKNVWVWCKENSPTVMVIVLNFIKLPAFQWTSTHKGFGKCTHFSDLQKTDKTETRYLGSFSKIHFQWKQYVTHLKILLFIQQIQHMWFKMEVARSSYPEMLCSSAHTVHTLSQNLCHSPERKWKQRKQEKFRLHQALKDELLCTSIRFF